MKKSNFKVNHDEFDSWIVWYGDFLKRVIDAKRIIKTSFEKRELIEALVLRCAARWEVLIIEDIITSLNKDASFYANKLGLRLKKHPSMDECKAMFIGYRYVEFRNVAEIINFGKQFLAPQFDPFSAISKPLANKIDEFIVIRNLLAHYSDYSWRSYYKMIKNRYKYKRIPEPGTFLIANTRTKEFRWSQYLRAFLTTSDIMLKKIT